MADFETTTDPNDCRVWGWGLARMGSVAVEIGTDVADFMERIDAENSVIYFHNLKFDAAFIIFHIMMDGYVHTNARKVGPGEFSVLMSDMGKMYTMKLTLRSGCTIEFRDSLKKLPMPVERVATSFKMEMLKGEDFDYTKFRPVGHYPDKEEQKYITNDVGIVSVALNQQLESGMTKLTVGSDALAEYKRIVGDKFFSRHFPVFTYELDAELRRAYRGGFTYSDPRFTGRVVRSGMVYDVNSLYPSVMMNELMPYGEPQFIRGVVEPTRSHPLTMFSVTFTAKLKTKHIPCIQIKGSSMFQPTMYQTEIVEPTTLMVTNVDWALYLDHYDIVVHAYGGGYRFRARTGLFDAYINKWNDVKVQSVGGMREIAKLHLNSLYGKFASNPDVTSKYPVMDRGRVVWRRAADEQRAPVYTPVGVFITSFARDLTVRAAQANYDVFAYADTDSLHLLCDDVPENLDIHPHRMGAWKHEYDFDEAFYIRPKAYLEAIHHPVPYATEYVNRIAGLPERVSGALNFDDVTDGNVLHGKLTPKSVPGGIVLVDTPYKLKL